MSVLHPKSRGDHFRLYLLLTISFLGWALFSRFSQASTELSWLHPVKTVLRYIFHADALTNLEHICSAVGILFLMLVLTWFFSHCVVSNKRESQLCTIAALVIVTAGYFIHQYSYELFDPRNRINQFHWDLLGLLIGWLLIWPSIRQK